MKLDVIHCVGFTVPYTRHPGVHIYRGRVAKYEYVDRDKADSCKRSVIDGRIGDRRAHRCCRETTCRVFKKRIRLAKQERIVAVLSTIGVADRFKESLDQTDLTCDKLFRNRRHVARRWQVIAEAFECRVDQLLD